MTDLYSKHFTCGLLGRAQCSGSKRLSRGFLVSSVCAGAIGFSSQLQAQQGRLVVLDANANALGVWYDSATSTAWVGGQLLTGVNQPVMWSIGDDQKVTPNQLLGISGAVLGSVVDISSNGSWVAGLSESVASSPWEGTFWSFGSWNAPTGIGWLAGGNSSSQLTAVSDAGTHVGISSGLFPCIFPSGGPLTILPTLPGTTGLGAAGDISADGTTIVGSITDVGGVNRAAIWTNSGTTVAALNEPIGVFSTATCISPDSTMIGGRISDGVGLFAAIWIGGISQFVPLDALNPVPGVVSGISNDGLIVGNGTLGGISQAFVWRTTWPAAIPFNTWFQTETGITPASVITDVSDVFFDGTEHHFAIQGSAIYATTLDPALVVLPCPSDLNGDTTINGADLGQLLGSWGPGGGIADLNNDSTVDGADLGLLLGSWGPCP